MTTGDSGPLRVTVRPGDEDDEPLASVRDRIRYVQCVGTTKDMALESREKRVSGGTRKPKSQ